MAARYLGIYTYRSVDWCEREPVAAAAYEASPHDSTGYSPNRLMLVKREVYAPLDVVLAQPHQESESWVSADEFFVVRQRMMRDVYTQVRQHLCVAAQRRKKEVYDIRTRPAELDEGDRVYYFNPRRHTKRSAKWQRTYTGPYTVTPILFPTNVV